MEICLKKYSEHINESILDPIKNELSPDIWDKSMNVKPEVKKQIIDIFNTWSKNIKLNIEPKSFYIVGSIATYQYHEKSDIDININIDLSQERLQRLKKIIPNGTLLKGTKHPINFFLSIKTKDEEVQQAIYNLTEEKWIKKPVKINEDSDKFLVKYYMAALNQAVSWARKISIDLDEMRRNIMELRMYEHFLKSTEYKQDIDMMKNLIESKKFDIKTNYDIIKMNIHVIKNFRKEAYPSGGSDPFKSQVFPQDISHPDYSINNIVYKILEKFNYIDKMIEYLKKYKEKYPEILSEN